MSDQQRLPDDQGSTPLTETQRARVHRALHRLFDRVLAELDQVAAPAIDPTPTPADVGDDQARSPPDADPQQ
jgi:hypothetical protein